MGERIENARLLKAVEEARSVRALAITIDVPPRTLQYQVRRGWLSDDFAQKVADHYKWPRTHMLELATSL